MIVRMRVDRGSSVEEHLGGGGGAGERCVSCVFGGLYIVRFMMMMVCTYEIYENGEKKNCDFSLT